MKEKHYDESVMEDLKFEELDYGDVGFELVTDDDDNQHYTKEESVYDQNKQEESTYQKKSKGPDNETSKMLNSISNMLDNLINKKDNIEHDLVDLNLPVEKDTEKDLYVDDDKAEWELIIDEFKEDEEDGVWKHNDEPKLSDFFKSTDKEVETKTFGVLTTALLAGGSALVLGFASVGVASMVKEYRIKKKTKDVEKALESEKITTLPVERESVKESQQPERNSSKRSQPEPVPPLQWPILRPPVFNHPHAG